MVFGINRIGFGRMCGHGRIAVAYRTCRNLFTRLKWKVSLKVSMISGIATFWTLAYTKLALISGLILSMEFISGQERKHFDHPVVYMQGPLW